jgi:hypothetical protein
MMFLNPIVADTGLCLRLVGYERKAGMHLKRAQQHISKRYKLDTSAKKAL